MKLLYYEEFDRIDEAFNREKQVQGWSRKKKEALINREYGKLPELSKNYSQHGRPEMSVPSTSSGTGMQTSSTTEDTGPSVPELVEGTIATPVETTDTMHRNKT